MAETSAQWDGTTVGDAATYAAAYCYSEVARYQRGMTCLVDRTLQGPIWTEEAAYNGQLEVTNPAGTTTQVDTGRAIVNGLIYENTAAVSLALSDNIDTGVAADGFYLVTIRQTFAAQEIRITLRYNALATPTPRQDAVAWEIPLASFEVAGCPGACAITAAGIIDERNFVNAEVKRLMVSFVGGYDITGTAEIEFQVSNFATLNYGFITNGTNDQILVAHWACPSDFISSCEATPYILDSDGATCNLYSQFTAYYGTCGQVHTTHSGASGYQTTAIVGGIPRADILCLTDLTVSLASLALDDLVYFQWQRDATDPTDTCSELNPIGVIVEYFGYKR